MAEILHHPRCHPNIEIMGVAGGSIKGATMQYMAGGAGFQPSTVLRQTCSIVSVWWSGCSFFEGTLPCIVIGIKYVTSPHHRWGCALAATPHDWHRPWTFARQMRTKCLRSVESVSMDW